MEYQTNALITTLAKLKWWLIFYIILISYKVIDILLITNKIEYENFLDILGINISIYSIIFIFMLSFTILEGFVFFNYEANNSPEFTLTRIKKRKMNIKKIIVIIIYNIVIRLLYFTIISFCFNFSTKLAPFDFTINLFFYSLVHLLLFFMNKSITRNEHIFFNKVN